MAAENRLGKVALLSERLIIAPVAGRLNNRLADFNRHRTVLGNSLGQRFGGCQRIALLRDVINQAHRHRALRVHELAGQSKLHCD